MKKLLFIPLDYHHFPHEDWHKAFAKYFHTLHYTTKDEAIAFNPDFVFVHSSALETSKMYEIKERCPNVLIMQWTGDCREGVIPSVANYRDISDVTFLAAGIAQKEMYEKELHQPVFYLQHAPFSKTFMPVNEQPGTGIVFIGNNHAQFPGGQERNELCELLSREFPNFEVIGNGYNDPRYRNSRSIPYHDSAKVYNESFVSISANCFNDLEGYWSNRPLDIMAAGGLCLMRYVPKMEEYFTDGEDCIFYRSNVEVPHLIRAITQEARNRIAKTGQELIRNYHTFEYRVIEMIDKISHLI